MNKEKQKEIIIIREAYGLIFSIVATIVGIVIFNLLT